MKKQKKQLILLLALLVIVIGAWQGLNKYNQVQADKEAAASTVQILSIEPDDIRSLTVVNENGTYALSYDGSNWTFADAATVSAEWSSANTSEDTSDATTRVTDPAVTADEVSQSKASTLAANLENVTGTTEIKGVTDFSLYGLDGAVISVTAELSDGTSHTLSFGDYNETASIYYLRLDESDSVFSVSSSIYSVFSGVTADDLVEQETEAITEEEIAEEEISEEATETIEEAVAESITEDGTESASVS